MVGMVLLLCLCAYEPLMNNLCVQSCMLYKIGCMTLVSTMFHEAFEAADSTGMQTPHMCRKF